MKPDTHRRIPRRAPLTKGPNGRNLCRQCATEVPPRRETFCSSACVDAWREVRDPGYQRRKVYARDHGICRLCGLDTDALADAFREAEHQEWRRQHATDPPHRRSSWWVGGFPEIEARLRALGFTPRRSFWDMDHVTPVVEGGGSCGLGNLRTLCQPCHKRETAALAARRALQRKQSGSTQEALFPTNEET